METETRPVLTKTEIESQIITIPYRIEMINLFFCELKENKIPFGGRKKYRDAIIFIYKAKHSVKNYQLGQE